MDVQRSKTSPHLPEEIIEAIISRAPVKTVLKFRCVSKPWCSLIGTKRFIAEHLRNSPAASSFIFNFTVHGLKQCDVDSPFCEQFVESLLSNRGVDRAFRSNVPLVQCVLGCIDGLVCFLDGYGVFSFWNPSTRVTTILPKIGRKILTPGFGFDESTGEFKVFVVEGSQNQLYERKAYSSKSNSWKLLETAGILSYTTESGILVCGKLHWARKISRKRDIVSFDIKTQAFGEIELPFALPERRERGQCCLQLTLGVLGGRLSSLLGHSGWEVEVWVMEEYGVKESWTKVFNLQPPFSLSAPFCTGPMGEIFFVYGSNFLVYYPNDNVFRFFGHDTSFRGVYHCVESLVTPDYAFTQGPTDLI